MAVSAFKSTSKRGSTSNTNSTTSDKPSTTKLLHRRSSSVSAISRSSSVTDFLNKRDNPLFCSSTSPPTPDLVEPENFCSVSKFDEKGSIVNDLGRKPKGTEDSLESRRGRSVSRNGDLGNGGNGSVRAGRSLSKVDLGRRRSVSRGPVQRGNYQISQNEKEPKYSFSSSLNTKKNRDQVENMSKFTSDSESRGRGRSLQTWSNQNPRSQPSDSLSSCVQDTNWEDGISTSSLSEAEERTIKAVFEQIENNRIAGDAGGGEIYEAVRSEVRLAILEIQNDLKMAIQRKKPTVLAADNVGDIPPELVNLDAVELVSGIRREYAKKLEQSEEHARKLRADLAVEEHRGQELGRILKEILPEPKASETRKSRFRRKNSNERRKMSRCLTEEAMSYFDECVSISTFDSSDFSSTEDPNAGIAAATPLVDKNICFPSSSASSNNGIPFHLNHKEELDSHVQNIPQYDGSDFARGSSSKEAVKVQENLTDLAAERRMSFQFLSMHDPPEVGGIHCDIRNYIKKFERKMQTDSKEFNLARSSFYDNDDYDVRVPDEKFLLNRVILNSRIESGGLLLCSGGIAI